MKRIIPLIMAFICLISFAKAETGNLVCTGIVYVERTDALDAAFSMLEKNNPFLTYYNKSTKADVIGGQPYDFTKFVLKGSPRFSKDDASLFEVMNGLQSGDYLVNKQTGEVMICIGAIIVIGFDKESAPNMKACEYYPIVLNKGEEGARVSVVGFPGITFEGYKVVDLQMEDWTAFTWIRM